MNVFSMESSARILYANGALDALPIEAGAFGKKALIITESIHTDLGTVDKIRQLLEVRNIQSIVFDEVLPADTTYSIDDAVSMARGSHIDMIIGLGSVGTLSFAKAVTTIGTSGISADKYYVEGFQNPDATYPYIEIPTSHRDPLLFRDECYLIRGVSRESKSCPVPRNSVDLVVCDPSLSLSLPPKYTAAAGMEIMLCCIDGLLASELNFIAETAFKEGLRLCSGFLEKAFYSPQDIVYREILCRAGMLAAFGMGFIFPGAAVVLPMAVAGKSISSHSPLSALSLPYFIESNLCRFSPKMIAVNSILGLPEVETAEEASSACAEYFRNKLALFGLPIRVRELEVQFQSLQEVGAYARQDRLLVGRYGSEYPERDIDAFLESIF